MGALRLVAEGASVEAGRGQRKLGNERLGGAVEVRRRGRRAFGKVG